MLAGEHGARGVEHRQAAERRHAGKAHRDQPLQPGGPLLGGRVGLDPLAQAAEDHVGDVEGVAGMLGEGAGEVRGLGLVRGNRGLAGLPRAPAVEAQQQQAHRDHGDDDAGMQRDAGPTPREGQPHAVGPPAPGSPRTTPAMF